LGFAENYSRITYLYDIVVPNEESFAVRPMAEAEMIDDYDKKNTHTSTSIRRLCQTDSRYHHLTPMSVAEGCRY